MTGKRHYHFGKLAYQLKEGTPERILELAADTANELVLMAVAAGALSRERHRGAPSRRRRCGTT